MLCIFQCITVSIVGDDKFLNDTELVWTLCTDSLYTHMTHKHQTNVSNVYTTLYNIYSTPLGEWSIAISLSVCLCISVCLCLSVCLSVSEHISGTAGPIFTKFCVPIPCGRGSVLLWQRCDMPCTSGFMDNIMFGRSGPYGDAWPVSYTHLTLPTILRV